jgi:hypothetical protein
MDMIRWRKCQVYRRWQGFVAFALSASPLPVVMTAFGTATAVERKRRVDALHNGRMRGRPCHQSWQPCAQARHPIEHSIWFGESA